jgi:hypothetical protein
MTQGYNRASPATIHTHELENNQESHRNREHSTSCRDEENRTATGGGYQPLCCSPWRDGRDFELQRGQTRAKREAARNHEGGVDAGARDLRQITPGPAAAQSRSADKKNRHEGVALQERLEPQTLAWKKTKEGRPMAARFRESKTADGARRRKPAHGGSIAGRRPDRRKQKQRRGCFGRNLWENRNRRRLWETPGTSRGTDGEGRGKSSSGLIQCGGDREQH